MQSGAGEPTFFNIAGRTVGVSVVPSSAQVFGSGSPAGRQSATSGEPRDPGMRRTSTQVSDLLFMYVPYTL